MAAHFTGLKKALAYAFLADQEHGQQALTTARLKTCEGCPNYKQETKQCGVCGCFMDIKAPLATNRNPMKLGRIEVTHCPKGLWPGIEASVKKQKVAIVPIGGCDYDLAQYYKN